MDQTDVVLIVGFVVILFIVLFVWLFTFQTSPSTPLLGAVPTGCTSITDFAVWAGGHLITYINTRLQGPFRIGPYPPSSKPQDAFTITGNAIRLNSLNFYPDGSYICGADSAMPNTVTLKTDVTISADNVRIIPPSYLRPVDLAQFGAVGTLTFVLDPFTQTFSITSATASNLRFNGRASRQQDDVYVQGFIALLNAEPIKSILTNALTAYLTSALRP
ncbi:Hypothetical protein POVN_LOCUS20 [uncultured virus]|nr:Hypothetical protein POVN_LOCUS20 [uncultured virus]